MQIKFTTVKVKYSHILRCILLKMLKGMTTDASMYIRIIDGYIFLNFNGIHDIPLYIVHLPLLCILYKTNH